MPKQQEIPYYVTIEVANKQCKGLRMLENLGIKQYTLSDIRDLPGGSTRHLVIMPAKEIKEIPENIMKTRRSEFDGESSAWFDSDGCDVCKAILSHSSFLISGRHTGDYIIVYSFVVHSFAAFKEIIFTVESKGLKPKILQLGKFKPTEKVLTRKQERALLLALRMGFFQVPRRTSMRELSDRLGVGLSTLSEIIRRGMRRLLEDHFET